MKQEMIGWQWRQLDYVPFICTSLWTDNRASTSSLKSNQIKSETRIIEHDLTTKKQSVRNDNSSVSIYETKSYK